MQAQTTMYVVFYHLRGRNFEKRLSLLLLLLLLIIIEYDHFGDIAFCYPWGYSNILINLALFYKSCWWQWFLPRNLQLLRHRLAKKSVAKIFQMKSNEIEAVNDKMD